MGTVHRVLVVQPVVKRHQKRSVVVRLKMVCVVVMEDIAVLMVICNFVILKGREDGRFS